MTLPWRRAGSRAPLAPAECHSALQRVLASPAFARSDRHRRFLTFVVSETLAGHSATIKETVIAAEVYERSGSFDPQTDSLVRVEARKLRKRLDDYYVSEGAADPVRIDIPKGSYVPTFAFRRQGRSGVRRPLLVVAGIAAAVAILAGGAWFAWSRYGRSPVVSSLAVLPFASRAATPGWRRSATDFRVK